MTALLVLRIYIEALWHLFPVGWVQES